MKRAAFPGSFDPPTRAHLWVLEEARKVFDEVTILVASNGSKRSGLLTPEERAAWRTMTASPVVILNGNRAITEELRSLRICNVVRGLRGPGDVEPELAYRDFMCRENSGIVVSYFMVPPELRSTSSTVVRSIVGLDDWHGLVVPYLQGGVTLTIEKALRRVVPEIKNPEGWWAALDGNWDDLLKFFALAGAPLSDRDFPDSIAGNAVQHPKTYEEMLREAKEKREHRFLVKHLNIAWFAAPDRMETRTWPGFFVLCDLCSEVWVFQEDWSEEE